MMIGLNPGPRARTVKKKFFIEAPHKYQIPLGLMPTSLHFL